MKHIVILKQKFYNMILNGEKTIESRWSMNKSAPYEKVQVGDEILLKTTGQPVTATARVKKVKFYQLTPEKVEEIRLQFGRQIGADKIEDWQSTMQKKFCTLIWLENVKEVKPIEVPRSYGAGWIIIKE